METIQEMFGEPLFAYTRADAIRDGVLVDVTERAKEAGFTISVAMTSAAWGKCVAIPESVPCQDETGRLWDVLIMLHFAIKNSSGDPDEILYKLGVRGVNGLEVVELKSQVHGGDNLEPVITIMLPEED